VGHNECEHPIQCRKILGLHMANTAALSTISSWSRITNMVRTQAHEAYSRDLDLAQRIQYVHTYLLAQLWHTAQVLPAPSENVGQIVSAFAWYIWQGAIFRVPLSTLQRRKEKGGGDSPMWRRSAGRSCYTGCGLKAIGTGK
jgi:hypothetical protein